MQSCLRKQLSSLFGAEQVKYYSIKCVLHTENDLQMLLLRPMKLLYFNPNLCILFYSENSTLKNQNAMEEYSYLISDNRHNVVNLIKKEYE